MYPGQFAGHAGQPARAVVHRSDRQAARLSLVLGRVSRYLFDLHKGQPSDKLDWRFEVPNLTLPEGVSSARVRAAHGSAATSSRVSSGSSTSGRGRRATTASAQSAMLADGRPARSAQAFDVRNADPRILERYGDNSFGWSLLMARRLVEAGVNMVQVNLGNFGSWDLHGNNFPLPEGLSVPADRPGRFGAAGRLHESGLLDSTLVVMAGEFGRTPQISHIAPNIYKSPGRDHWGPLQTVWFAGGGVRGGSGDRRVRRERRVSRSPTRRRRRTSPRRFTMRSAFRATPTGTT